MREEPSQDLPISADPAEAAAHISAVARRVGFVKLHIADETGPHIASFNQIVTEDQVLREAILAHLLEGFNVIYALADV